MEIKKTVGNILKAAVAVYATQKLMELGRAVLVRADEHIRDLQAKKVEPKPEPEPAEDVVDVASEDSFPASDAPAWTGGSSIHSTLH